MEKHSGDIRDGINCSICFHEYDEISAIPVVTKCGHTFCKSCSNVLPRKGQQTKLIECPVCRTLLQLPLPHNYSLISLLNYWRLSIDRKFSHNIAQPAPTAASGLAKPGMAVHSNSTGPQVFHSGYARVSFSPNPVVNPSEQSEAQDDDEYSDGEIDEETMKILIRQNFFKDEGIYAWMCPETESEDTEEFDTEDENSASHPHESIDTHHLGGNGRIFEDSNLHRHHHRGGRGGRTFEDSYPHHHAGRSGRRGRGGQRFEDFNNPPPHHRGGRGRGRGGRGFEDSDPSFHHHHRGGRRGRGGRRFEDSDPSFHHHHRGRGGNGREFEDFDSPPHHHHRRGGGHQRGRGGR